LAQLFSCGLRRMSAAAADAILLSRICFGRHCILHDERSASPEKFRYVCLDCRAYLSRPEDRYSKPAKCGYDPYTTQWR
jgi:hypothetical protein